MVQEKSPVLKVIKVEVTREDGTIYSLEGDNAEKWNRWITSNAVMAFIHGAKGEELPWKITNPQ